MSHPTGSNLRPLVVLLLCSGWYSPGPSGFKPVDLISTVFLTQWLPTIQLLIRTVISTSCTLLSLCHEEFHCLLSMYLETTSYQGRAISPAFALGSERSKPHSQVIVGKPAYKTTDDTHQWFITSGYDGLYSPCISPQTFPHPPQLLSQSLPRHLRPYLGAGHMPKTEEPCNTTVKTTSLSPSLNVHNNVRAACT